MIRDYFSDLELSSDCDSEAIRQAYRRLARRFHPDLNPRDEYAAESFRRIQEAFDYLSVDKNREDLRQKLDRWASKPGSLQKWRKEPQFFGDPQGFTDEWTLKSPRPAEELSVHIKVEIQAGTETKPQSVELNLLKPCSACRGQGGASQSVQTTCKACAGLSYQLIRRGAFRWKKTCDSCLGKGYQVVGACQNCTGSGKITKRESLILSPPQPIPRDSEVCYPEKGHTSFDGKMRGDLWVQWKIKS